MPASAWHGYCGRRPAGADRIPASPTRPECAAMFSTGGGVGHDLLGVERLLATGQEGARQAVQSNRHGADTLWRRLSAQTRSGTVA